MVAASLHHDCSNQCGDVAAEGEALRNKPDNRIPHWKDYIALKIEYANCLQRLAAFNERVARASHAGYSAHHIPRLALREVRWWARLYNSGTPAVRRLLTGRKRRKS
jgi:hypothetical protein